MKKILIALFLLFSLATQAQSSGQSNSATYIDWQLSNQGCNGCASFYWEVGRTIQPSEDGYYTFDVWFYSNSSYSDGTWAPTYLYGVSLFVDGYLFNSTPVWAVFKNYYTPSTLRFKTTNPNPLIQLTWAGLKVS